MPTPSRRDVLGAAIGAAVIGYGGYRVGRHQAGAAAAVPTSLPGVRVESGTLRSAHVPGRDVGWSLALPPRPRGLVVALHGSPGQGSDWVRLHGALGAVAATGMAIVGVDGSESWWHPRRAGPDAGTDYQAMIVADLLPAMAARGLRTARIGLLGLSMGGYGALLLAARLGPAGCFGVATMSAAIYRRLGEAESEAFDDEADFEAHDLLAQADRLSQLPVWLAVGADDDLLAGNQELARRLPQAVTVSGPGAHDNAYWTGHIAPAVAYLAAHAPTS